MQTPRLVIAGNASGAGKTTVAIGLIAALRARGLRVQPFKCGPDYMDPAYLSLAAGQACRSVDSWLIGRQAMLSVMARACTGADVAIVEGIMGLYDGRSGLGAEGTTAEVAKWLRAPVLLVLDVGRTAQSAGAIALGFHEFDHDVQIVGVVLNNIADPAHLGRATEAVEAGAGLPVLGHLARNQAITLPERHPCLLAAGERDDLPARIDRIQHEVEASVDVDALLQAACAAWPLPVGANPGPFPPSPRPPRIRLGVAQDEAFDLYQPGNLDLLTAWGAELVPTSPLRDAALPPGLDGLYFGPGFPELHAAELAANESYLRSVREVTEAGLPVYAECGGLIYLCQGLTGVGGRHALAGVVPAWAKMGERGVHVGYALAVTAQDTLIAKRGKRLRGYEFYWARVALPAEQAAYRVLDPEDRLEGYARAGILASHLRLHFASDAALVRSIIDVCARRAEARARP